MGDTYMALEVRDARDFDGALHVKVRFSLFVEYEGEDWGRGHPQCCSLRGQSRHSRFIRRCATPSPGAARHPLPQGGEGSKIKSPPPSDAAATEGPGVRGVLAPAGEGMLFLGSDVPEGGPAHTPVLQCRNFLFSWQGFLNVRLFTFAF